MLKASRALIFALCALLGACASLRSTSQKIGVSPDSVSYLTMAEGIAAGEGFVDVRRYSTPVRPIYPPGYPLLLAAAGLPSGDPLAASRWLNALLLAGGAALLAWGAERATGSLSLSLLGGVLFAVSTDLAVIYGRVWSEVFFVPLIVGYVVAMARYLEPEEQETGRRRALLVAAACAALAVSVRYPGVAALFAGCCVLLLPRAAPWRRRLQDALIFGALGSALLVPWLMRNVWVFGRPYLGSARSPSSFSFRQENMQRGLDLMLAWTGAPVAGLTAVLLVAVACGAASRRPAAPGRVRAMMLASFSFAAVYLGTMAIGTYVYGLNKPFDARSFGPAYGPVLLVMLCGAAL
ncbi:MAG: phospholipid carrier-dependent glycosyltransferase, partial [Acidobacteriota bacterium]